MKTYRATVTREDGWWMVSVPELELLTQAISWGEVEAMARGVIAAALDVETSDVRVDLEADPGSEARHLIESARDKASRADTLRDESLADNQAAARSLHAAGWSYRNIGKMMGLSHQRAEQLVKGRR